mgnify:CR=1 FL=1
MSDLWWYIKHYFIEIVLVLMLVAVLINNRSLLWQ